MLWRIIRITKADTFTLARLSFHLCVTYVHTHEEVAESFIADLKEVAAGLMADPDKRCTSGTHTHVYTYARSTNALQE